MGITMREAEALLRPGRMLIGDEWISAGSGGEFVHVNPSTGRGHPPIPLAGSREVDLAVGAARTAHRVWRSMPVDQRRDAMLRLAAAIRAAAGEIATLNTLDNGAPTPIAMGGAMAAVDNFTYYAGWVDKVGGEVIPTWPAPALDYAIMEPYGVVGVIIPWNVPMFNIGQVVGAALAAGNAVVLKAPELAPFTVLRFGQLVRDAGLPAGLVNVLPGRAETGAAMVAHPGIDKIHFIGGGGAARKVMQAAAETLKPLTFELGGKSANIIFADADLAAAARIAAFHSMGMSGQGCLVPSRLLVDGAVYDQVIGLLLAMIGAIKVGDPFEEGTYMGPVITRESCERILGVIERAKSEGAKLLAGGERLGGGLADGFFIQPTVFGEVDARSDLARNEVFGPVLAVMRFDGEEQALAMANDTPFGLAAYVHTNDLRRAHRVAGALEAGTVWVNGSGVKTSAPFGGVKQSGFGRMGGRYGLEDFLRPKNVYIPLA